jgi:DNA-binding beta-propeller fold protein YncE
MVLRALTLAALLLALGAAAGQAENAGGTVVAFVAVETTSELVAFELAPNVLGRVAVPAAPRNVTATGDLRYLLVTSPQARTVSLVDSYTMRVVKVFRGFGRPLDVAVESWNAYVTDARRNELVVIDLVRRRIASRIDVAAAAPERRGRRRRARHARAAEPVPHRRRARYAGPAA